MRVQSEPFRKLRTGTKIIESRLYDEKRQNINLGDEIEFHKEPDQREQCLVKVIGLLRYPSFTALMSDFPPEYFGGQTQSGLLDEIHSFYTTEQEDQYGVLGIRVKLLAVDEK